MTPPEHENAEAPEGAIAADQVTEDASAPGRSPKRPSPRSRSTPAARSGATNTTAARRTGGSAAQGKGGAAAGSKGAAGGKSAAKKASPSAEGVGKDATEKADPTAADAGGATTSGDGRPGRTTPARRTPAKKAAPKATPRASAGAAKRPGRTSPTRPRVAASKPAPDKDVATEPSAADRDLSTQPVPVVGPQVRAVVTPEEHAPAIFRRSADADEADDAAGAPEADAAAGGEPDLPVAAADAVEAEAAADAPETDAAAGGEPVDAAAGDAPEGAGEADAEAVPSDHAAPAADTPGLGVDVETAAGTDATDTDTDTSLAPVATSAEPPPVPSIPAAVAAAAGTARTQAAPSSTEDALTLRGVVKTYGGADAVYGIDLTVPAGSFYGIVGPNGAGKTTTLSMISGLLKPDAGTIEVFGTDLQRKARAAKALIGVLPDRLRTFDRLTGRQLLYYFGVLRGLKPSVVAARTEDLARAFDIDDALGRVVADYSAGMRKKVMLAGALIHSPRLLVLDEPFEAVDPVSAVSILEILSSYVSHGGTVVLSSHGMELVESVCTRVAVIVGGQVLAEGTIDEVRGEISLEQRFVELSASGAGSEGLEWLHRSSD